MLSGTAMREISDSKDTEKEELMKKRRNLYLIMLCIMLCIYIGLLIVLVEAESGHRDSTIRSLGDAFWYSIVTISTVGYGDIIPVTTIGHIIGFIFLVLSTGIMVMLLGTFVSFLTGETLPLMILGLYKKRNWYYFADYGMEANVLAGHIMRENPNAVIIYGEKMDEQNEIPDYPCYFLNVSPARIVAQKKGIGSRCKVFLMKENDIGKNIRAVDLPFLPVEVYARTTNRNDNQSGNIHYFHSYDCCARQYWQRHPLCLREQHIVIIGFDNYGQSILERAILTNVVCANQHVVYHIFGNPDMFLEIHHKLGEVFSINQVSDQTDSLIFHQDGWSNKYEILQEADRIIICEDDEECGWDIYWNLISFYELRGQIDLRSNRNTPGVSFFGTDEEIYTPQQVLRTRLNEAAVIMNDLFCQSVPYPTLGWKQLDAFHRQSKIAAADHLLMKVRILLKDEKITEINGRILQEAYEKYNCIKGSGEKQDELRKIDHLRWLRFYTYYNWSYGEKRNDNKREHPMLRPYEGLTTGQKMERDFAWELMGALAERYHPADH